MRRLFFVAIIPAEPIRSEVHFFKQMIADEFESRHALRSPAHITLFPPFFAEQDQMSTLSFLLEKAAEKFQSFQIQLNGFGAFKPRVIFVRPDLPRQLVRLEQTINDSLINYRDSRHKIRPFRPHITVAFKDLTKKQFYEAWHKYQQFKYERTFLVTSIYLLIHRDKQWEVCEEFPFASDEI